MIFPESTGRQLECGFLPNNEMADLIDAEEKARYEGRTVDLVDDGKAVTLSSETLGFGSNNKKSGSRAGNSDSSNKSSDSPPVADPSASVPIDKLFMKTKASPSLYYKPLTDEEISARSDEQPKFN